MALDFDGTDDRINFGDSTTLEGQLGMTVAAWINSDTVTVSEGHIVTRGRGGASGWNFNHGSGIADDELQFTKHRVVNINSTAINLSATTWTLVAAVVSSTQVRFHKYPVGGPLTSENVANNQAFDNTPTPTESNIGCVLDSSGNPVEFFEGLIAEVAKWNRELSDAEITALGKGFSPLFMSNSLEFYAPLIGRFSPEINRLASVTGTITGAVAAPHPRIIYPSSAQIRRYTTAAAPEAAAFLSRLSLLGVG